MQEKLKAGYARADITPTIPLPLSGYGNTMTRMNDKALEPICATCIAFEDAGGQLLFLFTLDLVGISKDMADVVIHALEQKYTLNPGCVILSGTHTHSAPDVLGLPCQEAVQYRDWLVGEALPALADQAFADLSPACMECARTRNEGLNYVRHYILENETVAGDNHGDFTSSPIRGHVSQPDRQIQLVKLVREGKKDILMMNWQAHPNTASTIGTEYGREHRPYISADFVGTCRAYLEKQTGMHFAYFQGASGNINSRSRMDTEIDTRNHVLYGQKLGDYVLSALADMKPLAAGRIGGQSRVVNAQVDHSEDYLGEIAAHIMDQWRKTNDPKYCTSLGVPHKIYSPYHAGSILLKIQMGERLPFTLSGACVGSLGFAALPYEPFDTNGVHIKENSPFAMTFVLGYANGYFNYIPSKEAFAYGCYESDSCKHKPGTAEEAAEAALDILRALHKENKEANQ